MSGGLKDRVHGGTVPVSRHLPVGRLRGCVALPRTHTCTMALRLVPEVVAAGRYSPVGLCE